MIAKESRGLPPFGLTFKPLNVAKKKILRLANRRGQLLTWGSTRSSFLLSKIKVGNVKTQLQALELWRQSLVASVRCDAPDLSARQMAILLSVFLGEGPHTVRGLARDLNISKPAVSRALDRLGELGYIRRERVDLDRRNVLVQQTVDGGAFLTAFADMITAAANEVQSIPAEKALTFALKAMTDHVEAMEDGATHTGEAARMEAAA